MPLSVDTYKAAVAEKALELGADVINDPSALTFDADLARKAGARQRGADSESYARDAGDVGRSCRR